MRTLPLSALFGFLFGFFQFANLSYWFINRIDGTGPTALFYPKQDSYLYLFQLKHYLLGGRLTSNPLLEESDLLGVGNSFIYPILGWIGNLMGLSIEVLFILIVLLTSITTYFVIERIMSNLTRINDWRSPLTSFFICITFLGDDFLRPSPTQWVLPFAIAIVYLYLRYAKNSVTRLLLILSISVLSLSLNPYYALFLSLTCLLPLLSLVKYKKIIGALLIILGFIIGDFVSRKIPESDRSDSINRWGFLFTHLPGSIDLTILILLCLVLNFRLKRHFQEKTFDFGIWNYIFIGLILTLQQNVITGIWWEPESHLKTITHLILGIYLLSLLHLISPKKLIVGGLILLLTWNLVTFAKTMTPKDIMTQSAKNAAAQVAYAKTIRLDLENQDKISFPLSWYQKNSYQIFLLHSNYNYFWLNEMPYFSFSNEFLFRRYACINSILKQYGFDEISEATLEVHGTSNKIQFYTKWNQLFSILRLDSLVFDFDPIDNFRREMKLVGSDLDPIKCRAEYEKYVEIFPAKSSL